VNIFSAWTTGFGIGLASIGGLWFTIRLALGRSNFAAVLAASQLLRVALTVAGFYAVSRESPGLILPALVGFWLARRVLINRWGGMTDAGT
jgi:F1F0 ATPase subunit 2